jgi:RNA polymerase sigma-70 factor, ECF subfamily
MGALLASTPPPQVANDDELVENLRAGDHDSLAILVKRYSRLVWSVAQKIVKDTSEAEDLVQTAFLDVLEKISQFDSRRGSFRSWLLQLTYSRSINRYHYLRRRNFYANSEDIPKPSVVSRREVGGLSGPDLGPFVVEIMKVLNPSQRIAIELVSFQGFTFQELAIALGESVANAKHHYYRGMLKMRDELQRQKANVTHTGS